MIRISQIKLKLNDYQRTPEEIAARALKLRPEEILWARIFRKSVDARDKSDVHFSMTVDCETKKRPAFLPRNAEILPQDKPSAAVPQLKRRSLRPIVVGMGPAGLFAGLRLAQAGLEPLVIERGRDVDRRTADVERFWSGKALDPISNVQFGEGGAGAFSDGKLNSGIKDPRCREVLQTFVRMGAPEEILYQAKPHVGTDRLRGVVRALREEIRALGGEVRFETKLTGLRFSNGTLCGAEIDGESVDCEFLILAVGHSARDTFEMLCQSGVFMERKAFSIGARIEHSQEMISRSQYGGAWAHPALGAADYKLSCHLKDGRAAYTFCMCPGGQVVAAASESGGVAVNGMSYFARDGENANSALLVSVGPEDFGGDDPLAGVRFQREWERAAFALGGGNYRAPAQTVGDFLRGVASTGGGKIKPSYRPGVTWTKLDNCLPAYAAADLKEAIGVFDRKIRGFADPEAVLTGVETRSSSPVRITRGEGLHSLSVRGLFPCGEGAGYAGGILSAAVDGLRCADALIEQCKENQ